MELHVTRSRRPGRSACRIAAHPLTNTGRVGFAARIGEQQGGYRRINRRGVIRFITLAASCIAALAVFAANPARASTAYGDLNNFDVVNDTGTECHGFEIELEDIHSTDITYTYDWNHYGAPTITEDNSDPAHPKVFVRYAAKYNTATNTYSSYTAVPSAPPAPTDGHQCTNPSVNFGCEHFGVGHYGAPTIVRYHWLVDPTLSGTLSHGPAVPKALAPLEGKSAEMLFAWVPKLAYPIREGEHPQTAFAFGLVLDWARGAGDTAKLELLARRVVDLHGKDEGCPIGYEPSGQDFLSPCIAEADLMRRVLPPDRFAAWLSKFLPGLPKDGSTKWLAPGVVTDRSDGKLIHLDGLNLSRAWMLQGIAAALPKGDTRVRTLRATADAHANASLPSVTSEHYEEKLMARHLRRLSPDGEGTSAGAPALNRANRRPG